MRLIDLFHHLFLTHFSVLGETLTPLFLNNGNPSKIRCFRRKGVCIIYVKIGSSVYRLNVKAREHILYKKECLSPKLMIGVDYCNMTRFNYGR